MKRIILPLFSLFVASSSIAQTAPYVIDQNTAKSLGGNGFAGSSFLTFGAGKLDSIKVFNRTSLETKDNLLYVYSGNTTDISSLLSITKIGTVPAGFNTEVMIRLANPVLLKGNATYTFYVTGFPIRFGTSDTYASGTFWSNDGEHIGSDLDFVLYIGTGTVTGTDKLEDDPEQSTIRYFSGDRRIATTTVASAETTLQVFDVKGNQLAATTEKSLQLPSSLSSGLYIVKLQTGNVVLNKKIYVQ